MEIVWNVRHPNVVPLSGYFTTVDEKQLMLYDHLTSGSVFELLHGKNGVEHVDWGTRLRIAIGIARGISHIHTQIGGKLVHGNIKASNIFLNSQGYGYVSDLGLANMTSTRFPNSARCYAPEVMRSNQNVSLASDVYSFGLLLLELLTRKSPVVYPNDLDAVDLVKLVNSVNRKVWKTKVFDRDLLLSPSTKVAMVKMLKIRLICVAKSPKKRPAMSEVVKMIEDIHVISTGNLNAMNISAETKRDKLIYFGFGNHTFDLGDLSGASVVVIGKGTYGTTYKAILENGIAILVKRLRDTIVTKQQLQQHIEDVGRTRHQNVAELRAYYYSKDETLLIYPYHAQGSVLTMLHGKKGSDKINLDWKTRLQIAVDAARGIAHIHTRYGGKLVHGNIRTSNIFITEQKHGVVAEVEMGNVIRLFRSLTSNEGDCAPELLESRIVSQAYDVYSFGVVLIELVSGKSSHPATYNLEDIPLVRCFVSVPREKWTGSVIDLLLLRYDNSKEAIVLVLQLAMDCIAKDPESRPQMVDIVKRLEEIRVSEKGS